MSESITVRGSAISDAKTSAQIIALLNQVLADLTAIQTAFNGHTHGNGNAGANTTGPNTSVQTLNTLS